MNIFVFVIMCFAFANVVLALTDNKRALGVSVSLYWLFVWIYWMIRAAEVNG